MKTMNVKSILLKTIVIIFITGFTSLHAQTDHSNTHHESGYWVVESNASTRDFTIIKFYDSGHQLMYEERLEGVYLDIKKRKHVKMLNKTLNMLQTNGLVAGQIKGYGQALVASLAKERK